MTAIDDGLLSPLTVGTDASVADASVLDALVAAEVALVRALGTAGLAPAHAVDAVSDALGWQGAGLPCLLHGIALQPLAAAAVAGGNPVIPLVPALRAAVPDAARAWVHRGATSQDILDTALMLTARAAADQALHSLAATERALSALAVEHRDAVAAARTLTQHAVPTTVGLRAATWLRGVRRAAERLAAARAALPAQLGGAGGTLASFVELARDAVEPSGTVRTIVEAFAAETGLAVPDAPWHVTRWPVTELGDALVQAIDAVGRIATDVATLSRTEIGELAEGSGGGSSAMPQKQNPAAAVLIRSAALRAPQLGATLHLASALAGDERPDGAWHAEWPTLRELLRLALGATAHAASMTAGLRVDLDAVARNLGATRGLLVAERLSLALGPIIGADAVRAIVGSVAAGGDLAHAVRAALAEAGAADVDVERLIDPQEYTGLAGGLVDEAVSGTRPATPSTRHDRQQEAE
ncbi:lyase family protein [Agrococcus beijingensis]|uniref:lyase family protein n=1 Tax=Agrococcus beijingensis TaxID=3068634 RepID=UPI002741B746|nr:lyase family protein [Agrococcus sp. REN33]